MLFASSQWFEEIPCRQIGWLAFRRVEARYRKQFECLRLKQRFWPWSHEFLSLHT